MGKKRKNELDRETFRAMMLEEIEGLAITCGHDEDAAQTYFDMGLRELESTLHSLHVLHEAMLLLCDGPDDKTARFADRLARDLKRLDSVADELGEGLSMLDGTYYEELKKKFAAL